MGIIEDLLRPGGREIEFHLPVWVWMVGVLIFLLGVIALVVFVI